ncbi:GbsR/MarR family transcriptional regulator [Haloglycomyces albus]|uniref:GbsR/MarR family transcriptional regulator n=1 Tax=Haloglycomyces albus TaxID=526067 RepID=UPI00046CB5A0|nr:hypothetical protein [Haloglycomyces albus]
MKDDNETLLDFVERFAQLLADAGLQKMTARVFAYILADDATSYTAAELAHGLSVSRAAISGAVRELNTMGLIAKTRRSDTRSDVYNIDSGDVWGRIMFARVPLVRRYREVAEAGAAELPAGPGSERLRQTAEFMAFMETEMSAMQRKWERHLEEQERQGR